MSRNTTILGTTQNVDRHYPVAAAFFETQLPLHDPLTLQLAGRWEKFYSDLTDADNEVFVPAYNEIGEFQWSPFNSYYFNQLTTGLNQAIEKKTDWTAALDTAQQNIVTYATQQGFKVTS